MKESIMKSILKYLLTIVITAFVSVVVCLILFDSSGLPPGYISHEIKSQILNENREVIVHLPESYNSSQDNYPVLYVVGGNSLTFRAVRDAGLLGRVGDIPELIIVGIPNISQKTRQRDLTPPILRQDLDESDSPPGEADKYLSYIKEEVIPMIEKNYRTENKKFIAGNSREGLFVMYTFTSQPEMFDARFVLSPALWRENDKFVGEIKQSLETNNSIDSYLFLSLGSKENEKMTRAFKMTISALDEYTPNNLIWNYHYTQDATHRNNAYLSLPVGLKRYFQQSTGDIEN